MCIKYIAPFALMLLMVGCGTSRKSQQSHYTGDGIPAGKVKILYPDGYTNGSSTAGVSDKPTRQNRVINRPRIVFTGLDTEHVRIAGVNPLPECGYIALDLDALQYEFCYPYSGKFISDYGMRGRAMHTGIDIKAIPNDTIRAAFPGVVRMSKLYSGYGNIVVIRHYDGFETVYSHGSKNLVKVNDVVEAGTPIALAGRTGTATTEHLHFEVRAGGDHIDPKLLVDPDKQCLRSGTLWLDKRNGTLIAYNDPSKAKDQPSGGTSIAEQRQKAQQTPPPKPKAQSSTAEYYRVKKGDTLSAIARRHSTSVKKLCELNKIKETSILQINQRLRVR